MNKPFFSFIIPAYNALPLLDRAVASLLNQNFSNLEVIIVNDGSTDATKEYLASLTDPRVHHYTIKNSGPSYARVYGIKHAKGAYIGFLDADDYFCNDFLEEVYKNIVINDLDLLMFEYQSVDQNNNVIRVNHNPYNEDKVFDQNNIQEFYRMILTSGHFNALWKKIIRSRIISLVVALPREITFGEDQLMSLSIVDYLTKIIYLDRPFYNYYKSDISLSNSQNEHAFDALLMIDHALSSLYQQKMEDDLGVSYQMRYQHLEAVYRIVAGINNNLKLTNSTIKKAYQDYFRNNFYHFDSYRKVKEYLKDFKPRSRWLLSLFYRKQFWLIRLLTKIYLKRKK